MTYKNYTIKMSIIVPVYNTQKYLRKCLDSLIAQTINDLEIIIVNDGSTDNSQKIIDEYVNKYPGKVKSFYKENGGLGSARNYGLIFAKGEYIGFIDSDDYVKPDMFEKMYDQAKKENAQLVICEFYFVNEGGKILNKTNITEHMDLDPRSKLYAHKYGRTEAFNKLYHRDLFFKTNIRYPKGWFEDYPTTPLLIEAADKISYVEDSMMYYVQRSGSIMNQAERFSERYFDILKMTELIVKNKERFDPVDYEFFIQNIAPIHSFLKYYKSILTISNSEKRKDVIKKWGNKLEAILPGWDASVAIMDSKKKLPFHKRILFDIIIYGFKGKILNIINPLFNLAKLF